ncbi:minor tail protein [Rhodococcus phage Apiary]|nr:minor tail protein [Rhodococcus phage Braxoaddie]WNM64971.1 minor tail protein [Rhodococcus phage Maselop]WNM69856.1 minor tail protein [Rhodococcus phage Apiary]
MALFRQLEEGAGKIALKSDVKDEGFDLLGMIGNAIDNLLPDPGEVIEGVFGFLDAIARRIQGIFNIGQQNSADIVQHSGRLNGLDQYTEGLNTAIDGRAKYDEVPLNVPLWQSLNPLEDPSFPRYGLYDWQPIDGGGEISYNSTSMYKPAKTTVELAFIRATRKRVYNSVGLITGKDSSGLVNDINRYYILIYRMDKITGNLTLAYSSGDIKGAISFPARTEVRYTLPGALEVEQGDILAVGIYQQGDGLAQGSRELAGVRTNPIQPNTAGFHPYRQYAWYRPTTGNNGDQGGGVPGVPVTITRAQLNFDSGLIPWFVLGQTLAP